MGNQPSMDDQFLGKIYQCIEDNLGHEHFSVEDLAQHAGLSRSMLHRKLILLTGKSASDLITEKRLIRAKELLENNVATASEIAYKVGFGSPSYFNKVFKNYFQVSPGNIRKRVVISPPHSPSPQHKEIRPFVWKNIMRVSLIMLMVLTFLAFAGTSMYFLLHNDKPVEKSIAILPFDDISSEGKSQYFADGIVEDLLNRISKIEGLKVISRTSSEMFRYKGSKTIPQIAEVLGVNYILEGTIQRESDNIRISIQLIDGKNDDHILSKQYDRNISEVFKIQSEISSLIASELSIALTHQQLVVLNQNRTRNLKAIEYYQMGYFHSSKRWIDEYNKGIEYYQKAISEDPKYGLAYSGLADNYHLMALQNWIDGPTGVNKARELARKALELDPTLAEPHAVLGDLYTFWDWDWNKAESELVQSVNLNPNYSTAKQYYSELLYITGRYDEAREYIDKALELNPFSFIHHYISSLHYYNQQHFMEALAENKICQELVKDHQWAVRFEFDILLKLGKVNKAVESFRRYGELFNQYDPAITDSVYKNEGIQGLLRVKIRTENIPTLVACWHVMLGEHEIALNMLEKLFSERGIDMTEFDRFEFQQLQHEPRYISLRNKMGLSNYQVQLKKDERRPLHK